MVLDVRPLDDDAPLASVERSMIDQAALNTAIRRFPYWVWQWRSRAINAADLHLLVPGIIAEYHRVVAEQRRALSIGAIAPVHLPQSG